MSFKIRMAVMATLLASALPALAQVSIVQSGRVPNLSQMPQADAFGDTAGFIRDMAASRMPAMLPAIDGAVPAVGLGPAPATPPAPQPIPFAGEWRMNEVHMPDASIRLIDAEEIIQVRFEIAEDGVFTANAGCNDVFGEMALHDGHIRTPEIATTLRLCVIGDAMLEHATAHALSHAAFYAYAPGMLVLLDAEGDKLAEFEAG